MSKKGEGGRGCWRVERERKWVGGGRRCGRGKVHVGVVDFRWLMVWCASRSAEKVWLGPIFRGQCEMEPVCERLRDASILLIGDKLV